MYNLSRLDPSYIPEVHRFIDAAKNHALRTKTKHIYCPYCRNILLFEDTEVIISHLVCRGFMKDYLIWTKHGKGSSAPYTLGDLANIDTDGPGMPADQFFHDTPQSEHVMPNVTASGFAGEMMVQELMSYQMIRLRKMLNSWRQCCVVILNHQRY